MVSNPAATLEFVAKEIMAKPILIQGGHILDPSQEIDEISSLLISGDKISWLGRGELSPPQTDYSILHAQGLIVCPGFIDLHCHLRQPGFEEKETIATGTRAAARGGFTTICCMPNTNPPLDNWATIDFVKKKAVREGVVRVLPIGCITKGREGRELAPMSELVSWGVVGFSDDGSPVLNPEIMRRALDYSWISGLPIIDHCEDTVLADDGVMNEGVISARLGLKGIPSAAEEGMVDRDIELARMTGGWVHIAHVSTRGSVELIRHAKAQGIRITAEVTPHHLTLAEENVTGYDTNAKVNPPLRTENDIKALIEGLKDNIIDIIATDHAPHTEAEKQREFALAPFGISGFETAFGSLMALVHGGRLTLTTLISKLTCEPARIIGDRFGRLGTLAIGASADIVLFDPNKDWVVDTSQFASKGKNTPLAGSTLKGKIMVTISQGKIVYRDDSVRIL
jgi:dihydroorotase